MMNQNVLVIAPHPDDETLGCGGTLLLLKEKGYNINWLIVTSISESSGFDKEVVEHRRKEIDLVTNKYGFNETITLDIPTAKVDEVSKSNLINKINDVFNDIKPNIIFIPFYNDVHSDHKLIAEAAISCTKWFRSPYVKKVLFYETISETDFNINSAMKRFEPNVYIDISNYLEKKLDIMGVYKSEMGKFPFPRSEKAISSVAYLRGSQSGYEAAEAFELLRANIQL